MNTLKGNKGHYCSETLQPVYGFKRFNLAMKQLCKLSPAGAARKSTFKNRSYDVMVHQDPHQHLD